MDFIDELIERAKTSTNPIKSIRAFCVRCVASPRVEQICCKPTCPLFDFRGGKNPRRKHGHSPKRLFSARRIAPKGPGDSWSLTRDRDAKPER